MAYRRTFRRRRKPVEWVRTAAEAQSSDTVRHCILHYDNSVQQVLDCSNIIIGDSPYVTESLIEERKTYVIDRIVGRVTAQRVGNQNGTVSPTYNESGPLRYRWGLFVGETDETGTILDLDRWDLFTEAGEEVDWIHREDYILGGDKSVISVPNGYPAEDYAAWLQPSTNINHAPWGMVDTRAKRRVGQEERLFIMHAVEKLDLTWNYTNFPANVIIWENLRVLIHWTAGTNKR